MPTPKPFEVGQYLYKKPHRWSKITAIKEKTLEFTNPNGLHDEIEMCFVRQDIKDGTTVQTTREAMLLHRLLYGGP